MIKKLSILLSLFILSLSVLTSQQAEAKNKIWNKPKGSIIWAKDADYIAKKMHSCLGKDAVYYGIYGEIIFSEEELDGFKKNQPCVFEVMKFNKDAKGYHEILGASIGNYVTFRYFNNNKTKYTANKDAIKAEKITKNIFAYYKKNKITKLNYAYKDFATQHTANYSLSRTNGGMIYYENGKVYKNFSEKPLTLKQFKYYLTKVETPYFYK